jgi:hypothetical protein
MSARNDAIIEYRSLLNSLAHASRRVMPVLVFTMERSAFGSMTA